MHETSGPVHISQAHGSAGFRLPLFDLHCDTLDRLALHDRLPEAGFAAQDAGVPSGRMVSLADNDAHISLERMRGYAWCACFAAFIPDGLGSQRSWRVFETVRDYLAGQLEEHEGTIEQVRDARDIARIIGLAAPEPAGQMPAAAFGFAPAGQVPAAGSAPVVEPRCAAIFTVEGASFFDGDAGLRAAMSRLARVSDAGVKMMTLTWNGRNALASGHDTTDGFTRFGRSMVEALEERRIVADVSHLNDRGFDEFVRFARRPFAASHSNLRAVCGHRRNLTDDRFRAIVDAGGIVGLNFCRGFLREGAGDPTCDDVLRHVDRMLNLGGEHAVALGSDYDGCDMPSWLDPAEKVGSLHGLFAREFGADIADAICFHNAHDFFVRNETV